MKISDVVALGVNEILGLHAAILDETGGAPGMRDAGLLASAVARPMQAFGDELVFPSLAQMAAALASGIILNHPFVDGNKRTGLSAAFLFLRLNGYQLVRDTEHWVAIAVKVACHEWAMDQLAESYAACMGGDSFVELDEPPNDCLV